MKYVVFLGDGMADTPVEALGGKTPLMVAKKPNIDSLAAKSEVGLAKTVPDGMKPGSDTANLSVMGYDPRTCYSGRSPLEALSMGIDMREDDVAVRCNLVTLSDDANYEDKTMVDYSAGEISTEEARALISYLQENLGTDSIAFYGGISYRHCLIVHHATPGETLTPPHDITGKPVLGHLPEGTLGELFLSLQKQSYELLKDHPINKAREAQGKNPANSIWLWGEGTKPALPDFKEKNGVSGAVISAVDLLKGIGKGAHMEVIEVEGATGNVNTDFAAKGKAAIDAFRRGVDYVYIHVEAPDESGHQGSLSDKIFSIEKIDSDIVGPVLSYLENSGEPYHVLVCPDHPTPLAIRTHSSDPIPYMIYKSDEEKESGVTCYDEESAKSTGVYLSEGFRLIEKLLSSDKTRGISPDLVSDGNGAVGAQTDEGQEEEEKKTEEEAATEEKSENEKKKKKGKFGAFFKKHLALFLILIFALLLAGGGVAGYFIATYHLAFIRSSKDLEKALSKKQITTLVFKKDVTVSGDLLLPRSFDLDMNRYTLTVSGALSIPVEKDVRVGNKKSGKYIRGGSLSAASFQAVGSKTLYLYSSLSTGENSIACASFECNGDIAGENVTTEIAASSAKLYGVAKGTISLSDETSLDVYGGAKTVFGGSTVTVYSGSVETVEGSEKCFVHEKADVSKVANVGEYYLVTKLAKPEKITVLQEGDDFYCYVSEVVGATAFSYSVNGEEKGTVPMAQTVKFKLEGLVPGKQTIRIKATAEGDKSKTDGDYASYTFDFSTKLSSPTLSIGEEGGAIYLTIGAVKYAEKYSYTVDGKTFVTSSSELKIDLTDLFATGGVHVVEAVAQSNDKYFSDSNKVMTSYVTYLTLPSLSPSATIEGEFVTFSWDEAEGASNYFVTYGDNSAYLKDASVTFTYDETAAFTVQAIGGGYYKSGSVSALSPSEIAG